MQLRALKAFPYGNRLLRVGDSFDTVDMRDARILVTIGHAEASEEGAQEIAASFTNIEQARRYRGQRGPDKKPRKKRGSYNRRDMQAEE